MADLAKDQPALAARALVQMGRCQERLGQADARKLYQPVIDEYPEQQGGVALAKARLAALTAALESMYRYSGVALTMGSFLVFRMTQPPRTPFRP